MISFIFFVLVILIIIALFRKAIPTLLANLNTLIDNCTYSTKDFYDRLTEELSSHEKDAISVTQKELLTGTIL